VLPERGGSGPFAGNIEGPMTTPLTTSLLTAGITALLGFVVFVGGQLALKLFVEPIQDQRRVIGRITHALMYYANVYEDSKPEEVDEGRRVYRDLGADLRSGIRVIPFYGLFVSLKLVRSIQQVRSAFAHLIGLANVVGTPAYGDAKTEMRRREIRESLGIEW
jgi:hypothetical protein